MAISKTDNDEVIKERAYLLWESAGRPSGREHEFWAQASREIEGAEGDDEAGRGSTKSGDGLSSKA